MQKNEIRAVSKYVRMSPSKIRRVLRQIQGKKYSEALLLLEFMPYASCAPIIKVLRSATANARNNFGLDEEKLVIKSACTQIQGWGIKTMQSNFEHYPNFSHF